MANWNKKDSQTDRGSTSGNREESMKGSQGTRGDNFDTSGTTRGNPKLGSDRDSTGRKDEEQGDGSMKGSSSGTTGLGSERNRSGSGSGGGIEGIPDESSAIPDEDRSRR